MVLCQRCKMVIEKDQVICGNFGDKFFPDNLIAGFMIIPAIRLIDKDVSTVREEPGDKFRLVFNNIAVSLFTRLKSFYAGYSALLRWLLRVRMLPASVRRLPATPLLFSEAK